MCYLNWFSEIPQGIDCNGHGTHIAGTVGGEVFGIAKESEMYGVRVLDCNSMSTWAYVIDGKSCLFLTSF